MSELAQALWERYRERGDLIARAKLLDIYLGLVHHSAREVLKVVSHSVEFDDLLGAGTLGLVQALEGFDSTRGLAFSTYAVPRIRGAMLDELRRRDWLPRSARARWRKMLQVRGILQQTLGRAPGDHEIAEALGIEMDVYWRWLQEAEQPVVLALDQALPSNAAGARLHETIPDPASGDPGEALARDETLEELRDALASLPDKDRLVLALYYYEGLNLKQIGEVLHVSESRVSQIRTRALKRLRESVDAEREET